MLAYFGVDPDPNGPPLLSKSMDPPMKLRGNPSCCAAAVARPQPTTAAVAATVRTPALDQVVAVAFVVGLPPTSSWKKRLEERLPERFPPRAGPSSSEVLGLAPLAPPAKVPWPLRGPVGGVWIGARWEGRFRVAAPARLRPLARYLADGQHI